jgi:hypothetical protein
LLSGSSRRLLEAEAMPIISICVWVVLLAAWIPGLYVTDSWLAFVDGRLIARHSLPHVDTLTLWMNGRPWTDQEWGAHFLLYQLVRHGGFAAPVVVALGSITTALVVCAVAARRFGGSARSTAIALLLPVLAVPWIGQIRAQTFALVPFVLVYALLVADARRSSNRVFLVVPLLVAWANLHGSVALAAGLVAVYGLTRTARAETRVRGAVLAVVAPLCLLASPYGLHLIAYYRLMLVNPPFTHAVVEWQPATFNVLSATFFLTAFVAAGLWGSQRHRLTAFERWALPVLLLASLHALRTAIWFELALAIALPRLLDGVWPSRIELTDRIRRVQSRVSGSMIAFALLVAAIAIAHAPARVGRQNPPAQAALVAAAAGAHGFVLADDAHADWLLWQQPALAGRIAYDVRFELFTAGEVARLSRLHEATSSIWSRCGSGFAVVTFSSRADFDVAVREHVLQPGTRAIVNTPSFVAVAQPASGTIPCHL